MPRRGRGRGRGSGRGSRRGSAKSREPTKPTLLISPEPRLPRFSSIVLSAPVLPASADIAGLTPCKESKQFAKREKQEIKKLQSSLKLYAADSAPALAINAAIEKTKRSNEELPDMFLVEKDTWISMKEEDDPTNQLSKWRQNGQSYKLPKVILLATNIYVSESARAKAAGFSDTVIMKPLRSSMVAACLQKVFGIGGRKAQNGRSGPNGPGRSNGLQGLLRGRKILVVDDNVVNRRVAAGALKKFGAYVRCAGSGHEALECLQIPHDFDACFMDIQMPEMDGFEATRLIREMESKANEETNKGSVANKRKWHIPIMAMTADVIHATLDECMKFGMDGYVSKPFQEKSLYQAVAKFFESNPTSQ